MLRRMTHALRRPLGVVLAGGAGRRLGGRKAVAELDGRPLIAYPLAALREALGTVVVVAKRDTELPPLPGVETWVEPDEPRHPLTGIVHALERAAGRELVVVAADLPFASAALVRALVAADAHGAPAVVPQADGRLQPLFARYLPTALAPLSAALAGPPRPLTETIAALRPQLLACDDARPFFNVNRPAELRAASALMRPGGASG